MPQVGHYKIYRFYQAQYAAADVLLFQGLCALHSFFCDKYYVSERIRIYFKGGELSSQFRWFTIAKIDL